MKEVVKTVVLAGIFLLLLPVSVISQSETYAALLRAGALRAAGDDTESLRFLNEFLANTSDYRLLVQRGEIYLANSNYLSAEADFAAASRQKSGSGSYGLAKIYAAGKNAQKSLAFLEENLKSEFRVSERLIMTESGFNSIENTSEWRRFWSTDRYSAAELLLSEVKYLLGNGKVKEAQEAIRETKSTLPHCPESIYAEALVSFASGQYQSAADMLTSEGSEGLSEFSRNKLLADCYFGLGYYEKAISLLTNLIDKEIPDADIFIGRARCYDAISDYPKSLSDIDFYLSIFPASEIALNFAGEICIKAGDNKGALKYLNVNLEANPNSIEAYRSRGEVWTSTRMWDYAVSDFSMALDLDPFNSEIWLNKGISLLNMGKKEEACHDFRQSMRLGNRKASEYVNKNCIR